MGTNKTRLTPGGGCLSRVSFHNPSAGLEPADSASVTGPGLLESFTGAAGLVTMFVGVAESGFALSLFASGGELFGAGRFLGAL